jgi:hypothetical protein
MAQSRMPARQPSDEKEIDQDLNQDYALLSSLAETKQWGAAIKSVFDRNWQNIYDPYLAAHIDKKNAKIKSLCQDNYEEFIGSVETLQSIRSDVQDLKASIVAFHRRVSDKGEDVLEKMRELMEHRSTRRNINHTIDLVKGCMYIINLAGKAMDQIESRKYFSALKTLDQLQRLYLPRYANYDFAAYVAARIPLMTLRVKDSVRGEFYEWLAKYVHIHALT